MEQWKGEKFGFGDEPKVVYSFQKGIRPYTVTLDVNGEIIIDVLFDRAQVYQANLQAFTSDQEKNPLPSPIEQAVLGIPNNHRQEDLKLLSVALVIAEIPDEGTEWANIWRVIKGETRTVDRLNRESTNKSCIDNSVLTFLLAERFGIPGKIKYTPHYQMHHYWQETLPTGDDGAIIDLGAGWKTKGLITDLSTYPRLIEESKIRTAEIRKNEIKHAIRTAVSTVFGIAQSKPLRNALH